MKVIPFTIPLALWGLMGVAGQSAVHDSGRPPFKDYFDVSPPQPDMTMADCAFQSGQFYFLFTKADRSELIATDTAGRVTANAVAQSPANHIYPRCTGPGVLAARPTRDNATMIEEYASDLSHVRTLVIQDAFAGGLCHPQGFAGLASGTVTSIDASTGAVRSRPLAAPGDEPLLTAQANRDSFVLLSPFSGTLQHLDFDGNLKSQALLAGPGLNNLRAVREDGEGLFAPAITSYGTGIFAILAGHSPDTGLRLQKYSFDGQFVKEWRLPQLDFEEFRNPRQAGGHLSNSTGSLLIGRLFVAGGSGYIVDTVNGRVAHFACGKLCGQ
ncbi:hypothetical protein [uncultured Paludibaculum sp.]|uniref:hypothetical protein n=1 Tax=uncultured Paludibaculum sp. TaxID=1765020 RepID=UPI002AAB3002|nr:hypothetical protein [uncultured Paludibaculum sp.]